MVMGAALFITEERAQVVDFSAPIYGWGEGVVIRDGDKKHYGSLADFKGAKVGTLVDSVQYKMIEALPGTDVPTYQDYFSLLADVRVGRIDLGVVDDEARRRAARSSRVCPIPPLAACSKPASACRTHRRP